MTTAKSRKIVSYRVILRKKRQFITGKYFDVSIPFDAYETKADAEQAIIVLSNSEGYPTSDFYIRDISLPYTVSTQVSPVKEKVLPAALEVLTYLILGGILGIVAAEIFYYSWRV